MTGKDDLTNPHVEARREKKREIEAKLILGSYFKGSTIAENLIAEKNVRHEPYEFGYEVGASFIATDNENLLLRVTSDKLFHTPLQLLSKSGFCPPYAKTRCSAVIRSLPEFSLIPQRYHWRIRR